MVAFETIGDAVAGLQAHLARARGRVRVRVRARVRVRVRVRVRFIAPPVTSIGKDFIEVQSLGGCVVESLLG